MGKASLSIQIGGQFDGKAITKAEQALRRMQLEAARSAGGAAASLVGFGDGLVSAGERAVRFGDRMTAAGAKVTAMTAPVAAVGIACAKMSMDFEDAMAKVDTIADTTEVPLDELRQQILDLSNDTGIAAKDIADNVYNAISAGQKTGDAVAFVGNATRLAKAGFTDSASALDVLTTTMNAYKLEATETTRVSDVLLMTQNKGKTTVGELASSMGRAIPTASAFNVNLENLAAAYATTTANGIATAESTTYINSMIKELGNSGSEVGKILQQETGKGFSELMAEGRSLGEVLSILDANGQKSNKTMYDMFGSAEAASAATTIAAGGAAQFAENLTAMNGAAGATDEAFGKMETSSYTVGKAVNEIKNVAIETGDAVVASLGPAIDGFVSGAHAFQEWFGSLDEGSRQTIATLGLLAVATGPVLMAGGKVVSTAGKGMVAAGKLSRQIGVLVAAQRAEKAAADASAGSLKADARASDAATRSTKQLAAAKNALRGVGVAAAIGLTVAAVSALAGAAEEASRRQATMAQATTGLEAAAAGATNAVGKQASATGDLASASSTAKADIEGLYQRQAELAQSMRETNTTALAQQTQLSEAYATIQQYANQSGLSAEAQGTLRSAVETVNQLCGTQVSVTDAVNGRLADEHGAIEDVSAALGECVQRKMDQIRIDAQQENLTALYKQQAADLDELARAQAAYDSEIVDKYLAHHPELTRAQAEEATATSAQAKAVRDAQAALDSVDASIATVTSSMGAQITAANGAATSVAGLATASPAVSAACQAMGVDIGSFSAALSNAGISVEQFRSLNATQLMQLVSAYKSNSGEIVATLEQLGIDMGDRGLAAVNALSGGIAAGTVDVQAATAAVQAAASGDWAGVVSLMGEHGVALPQAVADGVTSNSFAPSSATSAMLSAVALQLAGGDVTRAGEMLGGNIDAGLRDAIANGSPEVLAATYGLTQDTIAKAKEGFGIQSPSTVFAEIGNNIDAGLANGVTGAQDGPLSAVGALVAGILGITDPVPGQMDATGADAGLGLSAGLGRNVGLVLSSAQGLAANAQTGVSGTPGALSGIGGSAGSGFAGGIGSAQGQVSGSAGALASAAQDMKRDVDNSHGWGSDLADNFAKGIRAGIGWVGEAARAIAGAAANILHFSQPDEGPWSGMERGGVTSGLHLAQNFAAGMRAGAPAVRSAADALARGAAIQAATGTVQAPRASGASGASHVTYVTRYEIGDVTLDVGSIRDVLTVEQLFAVLTRAKAGR